MTASKSPSRNTFQKERYVQRRAKDGNSISEAYLSMWDSHAESVTKQESDPTWQKNNLEWDLRTTDWILAKVRSSESYAQNLYAAMCNNGFIKNEMWPILAEQEWGCTWRYAGGIIADMRQQGDYIDWYCSGIKHGHPDDEISDLELSKLTPKQQEFYIASKSFVPESVVTEEIEEDLRKLGWLLVEQSPS
jgi:hypothetical protein